MRLLADAHYFTSTLTALEGIDGPGSQLEVAVNNIRIKDKRTFQAAKAQVQAPPAPPAPKTSGFSYNFGKILK
jgi:vacuolar protein sorting-associated protein 54